MMTALIATDASRDRVCCCARPVSLIWMWHRASWWEIGGVIWRLGSAPGAEPSTLMPATTSGRLFCSTTGCARCTRRRESFWSCDDLTRASAGQDICRWGGSGEHARAASPLLHQGSDHQPDPDAQ